ncbi:MAG: hypothetical protein JNL38_34855 [Myxococcales bacterium]|jgi:hypothetical protein|nr:hypothetical protein [Myxococcales bacterium]
MQRRTTSVALSAVLLGAFVAKGCDPVPIDDERNDRRLFAARGVIRGTVTYSGPRPCSRGGHITGSAIVLVFDKKNPPPPTGFASQPVNFVAVPGDVLFANEPRSTGDALFCPDNDTVTASAPFTVAPLDGGEYVIAAFYDRAGRFLPTFEFRNLPEAGDIGGGFIDLTDYAKNATNPNYTPVFLPVAVGVPQQSAAGEVTYVVPSQTGYVADNVPVNIGAPIRLTRPYFYPEGAEADAQPASTPANPRGDARYVPTLVMTQDHHVLALPKAVNPQTIAAYQQSFKAAKLVWGVPQAELSDATDPAKPFGLQISPATPAGSGGILTWSRGTTLPENASIASLWPLVVFSKLLDDKDHKADPQSVVLQGNRDQPIVLIQGITLNQDSLLTTAPGQVPLAPTAGALRDHVTALVRPAALCISSRAPDKGAVLVTPHTTGKSSDPAETGDKPLFDPQAVIKGIPGVRQVVRGCLPTGRYAMTLVYPSGQAWTVPNEAGSCGPGEGSPGARTCTTRPRAVLPSQGTRAVLEIVPPTTPEGEALCRDNPVPEACTRNP